MPTEYRWKRNVERHQWSEEDLRRAAEAVRTGQMGVREACRNFKIPPPTFRRRLKNNDFSRKGLGPPSILGSENELKLKNHIQKLEKHGFAPTRDCVRAMAFNLAEQLNIKHTFNREKGLAGYDWLNMFLKRNPDLSVRKAEGVSLARCQGMNKTEVSSYFTLLQNVLEEADIMGKPGHLFNMDETGLQLNNKPGYVIAKKGSKNVAAITSSEKGETITIISCCNAEGFFLPPACIFKGQNKKKEFEDGMPPGSVVYMNKKSAYISTELMFTWLKNHFVPRKPEGKVILMLDGHASHCNSPEMLEYAEEHQVLLFCLPSHTTQFLQPLDRSFFKSLKAYFNSACNRYVRANPTRKISRLNFGELLADAWSKSATIENAVSAFKSTGICPFNPEAIPNYAYLNDNENDHLEKRKIDNLSETPEHLENPGPSSQETRTNVSTVNNGNQPIAAKDSSSDGDTPGKVN
ncbi:uncharacterized protein LOC115877377 [Sitophilus oryzae]|uniref:Uncharacterized protein LOC115877377 n=1 Tax=Sitophilus oryzae TaxID=7048 RepID=A0A6J2XE10_SITOR|nr:uncharacterized protein LOC115877377 [Sitophilus oryzae]